MLCIALICALTLLCSCTGGPVNDGPGEDDPSLGGKYPEGDDPGKLPEGPDDQGQSGGSTGRVEPDLSEITADDFTVELVYNEEAPIGFWCDAYAGRYTEGALYLYEASLRLCFEYDGEREYYELGSIQPAISSDSERLVDDMNCFVSSSDMKIAVENLLDDFDEDDLEDAIEDIFDDAFRSYADVSDASLEKFMRDVFGMSELRAACDTVAEQDNIITLDEGWLVFEKRPTVTVNIGIDKNTDGYFDYYSYLPHSAFDKEELWITEVEYGGEYIQASYNFYISEHLDFLEEYGLTITDDGILVDEKFCDVFGRDYDAPYDEQGVKMLVEIELADGSYQPTELWIEPAVHTESLRYSVSMPEKVYAPLNFEEGALYAFEVDINGLSYPVEVKSNDYYVTSLEIISSLPDCLQKYGYQEESVRAVASFVVPDRIVYNAMDVPATSVEYNELYTALYNGGSFTFYYGDSSTTAYRNSRCGTVSYSDMLEKLRVVGSDSENLRQYLLDSTHSSSEGTLTLECTGGVEGLECPITANVALVPYINSIDLEGTFKNLYYIGDSLDVNGAAISVWGQSSFADRYIMLLDTVSITADMVTGFDSSAAADNMELTVTYAGFTEKVNYTIKLDTVVSIALNPLFWSFHVIDTTVDLSDSYITATYESGKVVENIPATLDQLSAVPTEAGLNSVTVTYEGCSQTVSVTTVKAKSAKVYEGLSGYYLIGEKPVEVILRVDFEANDFDIDYDYIVVPAADYESFDTAAAGNKTWNYTYAGIDVQHKYEVLSAAYVGYTVNDNKITIDGVYTNIESVPSLYYTMTTLKVLEIPAEIDGVAVTKIAARAFEGMNMIEELTIPDSVTEIGNYAFRNATALKTVKIPTSATVGTKILAGCTKLESLYIGGAYSFLSYFDSEYPTEATVYINEGVTELCANFIENLTEVGSLKKLVLPTTLTKLCVDENEVLAWELYRLRCIGEIAAADGGYFSVVDGILFANYGKILYYYPQSKTDTSYTIPAGVESVVYFGENEHIKSVTIPASVTELGDYVFYSTISLETIVFEGSLDALPYGCFGLCESLVNFNFPKGITSIGDSCFEYTAIKSIVIPKGVTYVGYNAFYMMKSLERLAVPSSAMESFKTLTFQYLYALKEFAYDGSCYIKDIGAIYDVWEASKYSATSIYVYDTASFEGGLSARTGMDMKIYVDASVKSITYGMVDSNGTRYYCEAGSLTSNEYSSKTSYNNVFSHWYDV